VYIAVFSFIFKRVLSLRKALSGKSHKTKNRHCMKTLPVAFVRSLISLTYLASEGMGCVSESVNTISNGGEFSIDCWDIIQSDVVLSMVFCTGFYVKIYLVPFSRNDQSMENVVRFDYTFKEQVRRYN